MTPNNAKDYIPLVQALTEGKTIQLRRGDKWSDIDGPSFIEPPQNYRIKPEPEMVPLEPQDVPPGSVVRDIDFKGAVWMLVTNVGIAGVCVNDAEFSYSHLMLTKEISRDGGKTWSKCEKPRA